MSDRCKMKKFCSVILSVSAAALFAAEPVAEINFNAENDFTLKNQGKSLKSFTSVKGLVQVPGKVGNGYISANQNLQDFPELKGAAQRSLRFTNIKGFPMEKGCVELWVKPYFNENTKPGKTPHNYIFRFFGYKKSSRVLTVFIINHQTLVCQYELEGGKKAYLYHTIKNWPAKEWVRLNFVWSKDEKMMYVNGNPAAKKSVPGALQFIDSVELGAVDSYLPFQGAIDEFKVTVDAPADLKPFPEKKKPVSAIKQPVRIADKASLLDPAKWSGDKEITVSCGKVFTLAYSGKFFTDRLIEGPDVAVTPGDYIRGDLSFTKKQWDYSSQGRAFVAFFTADGKLIRRLNFDSSNIKGYSPFKLHEFIAISGVDAKINYFNYWQVPEKAAYLRTGWLFRYNPSVIEVENIEFAKIDPTGKPWRKQPTARGTKVFATGDVSDAEIDKMLASRKHPVAQVKKEGERVNLYIDGKPVLPYFVHNTPYNVKNTERWTAEFNRIGFKIATVWVAMGQKGNNHYPTAIQPDGKLDFTGWREAIRTHAKQNPGGHIFLALYVFPSRKFINENDDQMMKDQNGVSFIFGYPYYPLGKGAAKELPGKKFDRYPSMASQKYTDHISAEIKRVLTEFEKYPESKLVAGVYLLGGDDAQFRLPDIHFTPDMNPLVLEGFKKELRAKYKDNAGLQKAWGDPNITFDKVTQPKAPELWPDKARYYTDYTDTVKFADYKSYYAALDRNFKIAIRKAAKSAVPRLLVGGYDCAYGIGGSWGHTGLHFGKSIDDGADFYIFIPSYGRDRDNADRPLGAYQFSGSLALHGKLGIMELDVRNPEIGPLYFGHYPSANYNALHDENSFRISLRRLAMQSIALGGGFHYYNLQPHWARTDKAVDSLKDMFRIVSHVRTVPETRDAVALMIDEDSNLISNIHPGWIPSFFSIKYLPNMAIQHSGVKYNYYLAKDALHKDFKAPGVLFFSDASTLTVDEITEIRRRYGNSGRVIVWQGAPSFLTCNDLNKIGKAINFKIAARPDYHGKPLATERSYGEIYQAQNLPVPLVAAETHDPIMKGVKGFFTQESTVVPYVFPRSWSVEDKDVTVLAKYMNSDVPGMAVRRYKDFTEVFIGQPGSITPQLFRNFAREAGITPWLESDDLFYCGSGMIGIGAAKGDGIRKVRFPGGYSKVESLSGHKVENLTKEGFEVFIKHRDFAVFKIEE